MDPADQLIVVDNGSTDETREIAGDHHAEVLITSGERSGQRNLGLQCSKGAYLLFVDSDMLIEPALVKECKSLLSTGEFDALIVPELAFGVGPWAEAKALEKRIVLGQLTVEAARAFTREALSRQRIGGWREDIWAGEDWDLTDRLVASGGVVGRTRSRVWHDEGTLTLSGDFRKKRYYAPAAATVLEESEGRRRGLYMRFLSRQALRESIRHPVIFFHLILLKCSGLIAIATSTRKSGSGANPYVENRPA